MARRTHVSLATLLLSGLLAACSLRVPVADPPMAGPALAGTAWVLQELTGRVRVDGATPTLQFDAGRLGGSDGCNRYSGGYQATGGSFSLVSPLVATQMACAPVVSEQARAYTAVLAAARRYQVVDDRLELLGADGSPLAVFAAQSKALSGTSWQVTGINNGQGGVAGVLEGTSVTMMFTADGRVSGSAGCNRYTAGYRLEGDRLSLTPAAATRRLCNLPEGVMDQEQKFLDTFATVALARFEADRLELRTTDGALALSLVRAD